MATTQTCSLAASTAPAPNVHTGGVINGVYAGAGLSASGSGMVLLCKIPASSTVSLLEYHSSGATTQTLNFGVRSGSSTSVTVSALLGAAIGTLNAVHYGGPVTTTWDATAGETFKYVIATLTAGSVTASCKIRFSVFYSPN